MNLVVLDTETSGMSSSDGICDLALVILDEELNVLEQYESLIDPEVPIKPEASGVHHITDDQVADKPTLSEFMAMHSWPLNGRDDLVLAAHNISFDLRMLSGSLPDDYRKLCTLKLARALWPDAPDHKLQTLRYALKLDAGPPHRAMGDVVTCISLLRKAMQEKELSLEDILQLVSKPMSPDSKISFGKHKGTKLCDLPKSYMRWLLDKTDNLDPELREAISRLV